MVGGEYPRAVFGKPPGASAYQTIEQDEAFEEAKSATAFKTICTSFEWKSSTNERHQPCMATLKVGDHVLVARYSDSGRDHAGRPHTLKIDCLLANSQTWKNAWASLSDEAPPEHLSSSLEITGPEGTFSTPHHS